MNKAQLREALLNIKSCEGVESTHFHPVCEHAASLIEAKVDEYILGLLPPKSVIDSDDLEIDGWHVYAELPTMSQIDVDAAVDQAIDELRTKVKGEK